MPVILAALGVPNADPLPHEGRSACPEAEVKPFQDRMVQPLVPGAASMTPTGCSTVTLQLESLGADKVSVPPGQYCNPAKVPAGDPVVVNVNWVLAGHVAGGVVVVVATVAQMMAPVELKPVKNSPDGQLVPAATLVPAGPAGPVLPVAPVAPIGPWGPVFP